MQLTSAHAARLVDVRSTVSDIAELHEISVDNNIMRMRHVPGIDLPAGTPIALNPGGCHIMLMNLQQPLGVGQHVPHHLGFRIP
jgi:copper(I)-binding protein